MLIGDQMKKTSIALLVTQLVVLAGCDVTKQVWATYSSTREGPVNNPVRWNIQERDRKLLLVMVHGFNSSNDQAWREFPRLIKEGKDTAFSRVNVARYQYGSTACRNEGDIADRGDGLKSFLSDELNNYDGMILMGHSLGGLVAMHGLIDLAKAHNTWVARIPVTLLTFATPHLGVEGAERLGQLGILCRDKQAKDVEVFNRASRELRKDWDSYFRSSRSKYRVAIKAFYGSEDTFVTQDSACGRFSECEQINPVNHVTIVKPGDTNHLAYKKLRVEVDSMTNKIPDSIPAQRSPPSYKLVFAPQAELVVQDQATGHPLRYYTFHFIVRNPGTVTVEKFYYTFSFHAETVLPMAQWVDSIMSLETIEGKKYYILKGFRSGPIFPGSALNVGDISLMKPLNEFVVQWRLSTEDGPFPKDPTFGTMTFENGQPKVESPAK